MSERDRFRNINPKPYKYSFLRKKFNTSTEKVENVVKLPKNPIKKNKYTKLKSFKKFMSIPANNDPTTFTVNVFNPTKLLLINI